MTDVPLTHPPAASQPRRRAEIPTPCLVVDVEAMERNIRKLQTIADGNGVALRPHAKVHRSSAVAIRQAAAGAAGIACATLGEAEALAAADITGILLTSPIAAPATIHHLAELNRTCRLIAVVDDSRMLAALDQAAGRTGARLQVLIDLDLGQRRSGTSTVAEAVELARAAENAPHLVYRGVQAYWGHLQGAGGYSERRRHVEQAAGILQGFLDALRAQGLAAEVVSGGGTGTVLIDAQLGLFTELQPGSYVLGDRFYTDPALWTPLDPPFEQAIFIRSTVLRVLACGRLITDAGSKAVGIDYGASYALDWGGRAIAYRSVGDEHGEISIGNSSLRAGDAIEFAPPYAALASNCFSQLFGLVGDEVVGRFAIDARGR